MASRFVAFNNDSASPAQFMSAPPEGSVGANMNGPIGSLLSPQQQQQPSSINFMATSQSVTSANNNASPIASPNSNTTSGGGGGGGEKGSATAILTLQTALDASDRRALSLQQERDAAMTALGKTREGYLLTDSKLREVATALATAVHENRLLAKEAESLRSTIKANEEKHAQAMSRAKDRLEVAARIDNGILRLYHTIRLHSTSVGKLPQMTGVEAFDARRAQPLAALELCNQWLIRYSSACLSKKEVVTFLEQFLAARSYAARAPQPPAISLSGLMQQQQQQHHHHTLSLNNTLNASSAGHAQQGTSQKGGAANSGVATASSGRSTLSARAAGGDANPSPSHGASSTAAPPEDLPPWVSAFILGTDVLEGRSIISASEADLQQKAQQIAAEQQAAHAAKVQQQQAEAAAQLAIAAIADNPLQHLKLFDGVPSRHVHELPEAHAVIDKLNDKLEHLVKVMKAQEERHTRELREFLVAEEAIRGTSTQEALKSLREKLRDTQKSLDAANAELKRYRVNASDYVLMQREVSEAKEKTLHSKLLLEQKDAELLKTQRNAVERSMMAKDAMRSLTARADMSTRLENENAQLKKEVEYLSAQLRRLDLKSLEANKERAEAIAKEEGAKLRAAESMLATAEARAKALADTNQRMSAEYRAIFRAHMEALQRQKEAEAHETIIESKQYIVGDRSPLMAEHYLGKYQEAMLDLNRAQRRLRHLLMVAHHDQSSSSKRIQNLEKDLIAEKNARWTAEESLHNIALSSASIHNGDGGDTGVEYDDGGLSDDHRYFSNTSMSASARNGTNLNATTDKSSAAASHHNTHSSINGGAAVPLVRTKGGRVSTLTRKARHMADAAKQQSKRKGQQYKKRSPARGGGDGDHSVGEDQFSADEGGAKQRRNKDQAASGGDDADDVGDSCDSQDDDAFYSYSSSRYRLGKQRGPLSQLSQSGGVSSQLRGTVTNVTVSAQKRTVTMERGDGVSRTYGSAIPSLSPEGGATTAQTGQTNDNEGRGAEVGGNGGATSASQQAQASAQLPPPSVFNSDGINAPGSDGVNSRSGSVLSASSPSNNNKRRPSYTDTRTFTSSEMPNLNTDVEREALAHRLRAAYGESGSRTIQSLGAHGANDATHQRQRKDVNQSRDTRAKASAVQRRAEGALDALVTEELIAKQVYDDGFIGVGGGGVGTPAGVAASRTSAASATNSASYTFPSNPLNVVSSASFNTALLPTPSVASVVEHEVSSRSIPKRALLLAPSSSSSSPPIPMAASTSSNISGGGLSGGSATRQRPSSAAATIMNRGRLAAKNTVGGGGGAPLSDSNASSQSTRQGSSYASVMRSNSSAAQNPTSAAVSTASGITSTNVIASSPFSSSASVKRPNSAMR